MSKVTVDLQMAFDGTGVPSEALFEAWAEAAWQDENPTEVTIRIVDNDELDRLLVMHRRDDFNHGHGEACAL